MKAASKKSRKKQPSKKSHSKPSSRSDLAKSAEPMKKANKGMGKPTVLFDTNEMITYVSDENSPDIKFGKKGMPIHSISFDEKVDLINAGISKKQLLELKNRYGFTLDTLSKILDITDRTIQNKSNDFKFKGNVGEKILGLSELYSYGMEVFQDRDKLRGWLSTPNPILNNKSPVELFLTNAGMQQVKQELGRIDYGIY